MWDWTIYFFYSFLYFLLFCIIKKKDNSNKKTEKEKLYGSIPHFANLLKQT